MAMSLIDERDHRKVEMRLVELGDRHRYESDPVAARALREEYQRLHKHWRALTDRRSSL
jgi:hypothetical protein